MVHLSFVIHDESPEPGTATIILEDDSFQIEIIGKKAGWLVAKDERGFPHWCLYGLTACFLLTTLWMNPGVLPLNYQMGVKCAERCPLVNLDQCFFRGANMIIRTEKKGNYTILPNAFLFGRHYFRQGQGDPCPFVMQGRIIGA